MITFVPNLNASRFSLCAAPQRLLLSRRRWGMRAHIATGRPGVREIAEGIYLYTTRLCSGDGGAPTFVYEVTHPSQSGAVRLRYHVKERGISQSSFADKKS